MQSYLDILQLVKKIIWEKKQVDIFSDGCLEDTRICEQLQIIKDELIQKQVFELIVNMQNSKTMQELTLNFQKYQKLEEKQVLIDAEIQKLFCELKYIQTDVVIQENIYINDDCLINEDSLKQNQIQQEIIQGNQRINQICQGDIRHMRCKLENAEAQAAAKIAKIQFMIRNNSTCQYQQYYTAFNFSDTQLQEVKIWFCSHQFQSNSADIIEEARQIFNQLDENKCQQLCPLIGHYYAWFKSRFRIQDIQNSILGLQEQLNNNKQSQIFKKSLPELNEQIQQIRQSIQNLNIDQNKVVQEMNQLREDYQIYQQIEAIIQSAGEDYRQLLFLRYNLFAYIQKIINKYNISYETKQELGMLLRMNININYAEMMQSQSLNFYKDIDLQNFTQSQNIFNEIISAYYNSQQIITSLQQLNQNIQESQFSIRVLQVAFNLVHKEQLLKINMNFIKTFYAQIRNSQKDKIIQQFLQFKLFQVLKFCGKDCFTINIYNKFLELLNIPQGLEFLQDGKLFKLFLTESFLEEQNIPEFEKIKIDELVQQMKYASLDQIQSVYKSNFLYLQKQQRNSDVVQKYIQTQSDQYQTQQKLKQKCQDNIKFAESGLAQIKLFQFQIESLGANLADQIEKIKYKQKQVEKFKTEQQKRKQKPLFSNISSHTFDYLKKTPLNNKLEFMIITSYLYFWTKINFQLIRLNIFQALTKDQTCQSTLKSKIL